MSSLDPLFDTEYDPLTSTPTRTASIATRPGLVPLSEERLKRFQPELWDIEPWMFWRRSQYKFNLKFRTQVAEQLRYGMAEPAIVTLLDPLVIACYTDELDCVVYIHFEDEMPPHPQYGEWYPKGLARECIQRHRLQVGSRLLCVCTYWPMSDWEDYSLDLIPGPLAREVYCNFMPYIADFLTVHPQRVEERKRMIGEHEWERCQELADEYFTYLDDGLLRPRDGRPKQCRFEQE